MLARLLDLGGLGQTWDEDVNWAAGRNYVTNVLSLDFSERAWRWNFENPPVMKLLDGVGAQFADGFGPARALSALWLSLGCALLVPIGGRLYTRRVGLLAGLIAALLPHLVAHGQIVGHESPTVLWWSLGILLSVCAHDELPEGSACIPGAPRRTIGACTVETSTATDLHGGRDRATILEDGAPVVSSDSDQRLVIYDARLSTPSGLRVGMTGAELERASARTIGEIECTFDEAAWRNRWWCKLRRQTECGAEDANWIHVIFDGGRGPLVKGDPARARVRTLRVVAIDLGPECGES